MEDARTRAIGINTRGFDSFRFDSRRADDARTTRRRVLSIHGGGTEKDGGKGSRARARLIARKRDERLTSVLCVARNAERT